MLVVQTSAAYQAEKNYALDVIFRQWLQLPYRLDYVNEAKQQTLLIAENKQLIFPEIFFNTPAQQWLKPQSLPTTPEYWQLPVNIATNIKIPLLWGHADNYLMSENQIILPFDLLGSVFFMLSRYEEFCIHKRDQHGRFRAVDSHALQHGYLERPVIDEYIQILRLLLKQFLHLHAKVATFQQYISCDVDAPYACGSKNLYRLTKQVTADILLRRQPHLCWQSIQNYLSQRFNPQHRDRLDTFDWMMQCNERAGTQLAFYFIAEHTHASMDGCYRIDEPALLRILASIEQRQHEIGLHGSYNSGHCAKQLQQEKARLQQALHAAKLGSEVKGHRFHFLRWQSQHSPRRLAEAGFSYDTSLGYADHIGFRCGTCHEFSMFDVNKRQHLALIQRPLLVMETSLFSRDYMGLTANAEAVNRVLDLKKRCRQVQGNFTLLWHNSTFYGEDEKTCYIAILNG